MIRSYWLILFVCIVVVSIPRFNREDIGPLKYFFQRTEQGLYDIDTEGLPFDVHQYVLNTRYFKGRDDLKELLRPPWVNRPGVPFLASFLPFSALTSINIINIISIYIASIFLILLLKHLKFNFRLQVAGSLLFVFSFPNFAYGSSGYIDASVISVLFITLYLLVKEKWFIIPFVILMGIFIKETIIVIIPVIFLYIYFHKKASFAFSYSLILLSIYLIIAIIIRNFLQSDKFEYWLPSSERFIFNVSRIKMWLNLVLSLGIPGFIALFNFNKVKNHMNPKILLVLYTGFGLTILLFISSMFSAYADGRFIWPSYVFTIPITAYILDHSKYLKFIFK